MWNGCRLVFGARVFCFCFSQLDLFLVGICFLLSMWRKFDFLLMVRLAFVSMVLLWFFAAPVEANSITVTCSGLYGGQTKVQVSTTGWDPVAGAWTVVAVLVDDSALYGNPSNPVIDVNQGGGWGSAGCNINQ